MLLRVAHKYDVVLPVISKTLISYIHAETCEDPALATLFTDYRERMGGISLLHIPALYPVAESLIDKMILVRHPYIPAVIKSYLNLITNTIFTKGPNVNIPFRPKSFDNPQRMHALDNVIHRDIIALLQKCKTSPEYLLFIVRHASQEFDGYFTKKFLDKIRTLHK